MYTMPYKRTYRKKRVYRKRKPMSVRRVARAEVYRAIRKTAELKHAETPNIDSTSIDSLGTSCRWACFPTSQGTGDEYYIGTQINPKGIGFRGQIDVADSDNTVRIIVVQWKGTPGTAGDASDILQITSSNIKNAYAPYNVDTRHRFKVLHDRLYNGVYNTSSSVRLVGFHIPASKLRKIVYTDASGTTEDGAIYMYAVSTSTVSTHPSIFGRGRVYYNDY